MPSFRGRSPAIVSRIRSKSPRSSLTASTCVSQIHGTTFTNAPPETIPAEKVMWRSGSERSSIATICSAISRIAERPEASVAPACAGWPRARTTKRWKAHRPVISSAPSWAGSGTSTKRLRFASASISARVARAAHLLVGDEQERDR